MQTDAHHIVTTRRWQTNRHHGAWAACCLGRAVLSQQEARAPRALTATLRGGGTRVPKRARQAEHTVVLIPQRVARGLGRARIAVAAARRGGRATPPRTNPSVRSCETRTSHPQAPRPPPAPALPMQIDATNMPREPRRPPPAVRNPTPPARLPGCQSPTALALITPPNSLWGGRVPLPITGLLFIPSTRHKKTWSSASARRMPACCPR